MNAPQLTVILLTTLFVVSPFHGSRSTYAEDVKSCTENDSKDYTKTDVEAADNALNAQYKKTRESLANIWKREWSNHPDESAVDTLVAAQRAWITYRDAECKLRAKSFDGGTAYGPIFLNCLGELTEKRTRELKYVMEDFTR